MWIINLWNNKTKIKRIALKKKKKIKITHLKKLKKFNIINVMNFNFKKSNKLSDLLFY